MLIYTTTERQTHSASFLPNSKHIRRTCFLREIRGRQSGRVWSAAGIHHLLPLPTTCYSSSNTAPAPRVLSPRGSPSSMGCTSSACGAVKGFPVRSVHPNATSSTLREAKKGTKSFFNSKWITKATQIHSHRCFITSPAQAAWNWDTSGPPLYSKQGHTDQLRQLQQELFDKFQVLRTDTPTGSERYELIPSKVHQTLVISAPHRYRTVVWKHLNWLDFTSPLTLQGVLAQAQC